jgi:nitrate/nitrite transport system permease protein
VLKSIASLPIGRAQGTGIVGPWWLDRLAATASGIIARAAEPASAVLYTLLGLALLGVIWMLASLAAGRDLPNPIATLGVLAQLVSNPLYDNGPNDKGVGIQLISSVGRVFAGFALASLLAIPVGFLMGANNVSRRLLYPLVQVMRPVSPLAWFPIGLAVFKSAPTATIFVIFMTSIWPTLINTAFGVMSLPDDHRNVARVFRFSRFKYVTRVLVPYSLPHVLTGLRLSMGVAWMVIVAGEMLAGGIGIGFFVWDSWNQLSLERVLSAILLIGIVGLLLDRAFEWFGRRFAYSA